MERRQVGKAALAVQHGEARGYCSGRSDGDAETQVHCAPEIGKRLLA